MYIQLLLITVVILSMAMLGMMLKILIKKKGKFPEFRVGHNRDMYKKGITCVKHDERCSHRKALGKDSGCVGC